MDVHESTRPHITRASRRRSRISQQWSETTLKIYSNKYSAVNAQYTANKQSHFSQLADAQLTTHRIAVKPPSALRQEVAGI